MKQEQVIELAKQAKVIDQKATMDSEYVRDVIADLSAFASLVEQATLERAAKVVDPFFFAEGAAHAIRSLAKEQGAKT